MLQNPHLDNLIAKETFSEMLATLTPKQLAVVALRLDRIGYEHVGEILGITRSCAYQRMLAPRRRIPEHFPHVKTLLDGES